MNSLVSVQASGRVLHRANEVQGSAAKESGVASAGQGQIHHSPEQGGYRHPNLIQ